MKRLCGPLLALMLSPMAVPAMGAELSAEGQIFYEVCLANAPALPQAAIQQAAQSVRYAGGSMLNAGGVQYKPGRKCRTAFPVTTPPSDEEIRWLAVNFATRVGGEVRQVRSITGTLWYEIRVGRAKYGVEGGLSDGARYFTISKR